MKTNRKLSTALAILVILGSLGLSGCATEPDSSNPQIAAINTLRNQLELPKRPLEFVETTVYSNSPSGTLQVEVFQDSDGRKFIVDPITIQVVEMDARALLENISPLASVMSEEELRAKAQNLFAATIPNFEVLKANWDYEEGAKSITISIIGTAKMQLVPTLVHGHKLLYTEPGCYLGMKTP